MYRVATSCAETLTRSLSSIFICSPLSNALTIFFFLWFLILFALFTYWMENVLRNVFVGSKVRSARNNPKLTISKNTQFFVLKVDVQIRQTKWMDFDWYAPFKGHYCAFREGKLMLYACKDRLMKSLEDYWMYILNICKVLWIIGIGIA